MSRTTATTMAGAARVTAMMMMRGFGVITRDIHQALHKVHRVLPHTASNGQHPQAQACFLSTLDTLSGR